MIEFHLNGKEYIQLNDLLKWARLVSTGGEANIRIESGEVIVNGVVETRKRHKLRMDFIVLFKETKIVIR